MTKLAGFGWWLLFIVLLPILLPQALLTKRRAIRLAPAGGSQTGLVGSADDEPLRLLLVGESTVAGVGVGTQQEALAGQLAGQLATLLQRPVAWQALGENGITASEAVQHLLPQVSAADFDLVLLVFGVNDTTHFSSKRRWQTALESLAQAFAKADCRIAFTAVPPMQHFSALPWLLRKMLGWRATLLDLQLSEVARRLSTSHCRVTLKFEPEYMARDGYHPSALGYRVWAEGLSGLLLGCLRR